MSITRLPNGVTVGGPALTIGPDGQPSLPGYKVALNPEGGYAATKNNWLQDVGVPLGIGSIFAYGAFGPGGYAGLGGGAGAPAAAGGTGPAGGIPLAYAPGAAATNMAALGSPALGGSVSGFGSGLLGQMFGGPQAGVASINAATNLIGSFVQAHQQGKATAAQLQGAQQALDFLKQQYATAQTQNAPYLAAGQAAVGRMGDAAANAPTPMSVLARFQPAPTPPPAPSMPVRY